MMCPDHLIKCLDKYDENTNVLTAELDIFHKHSSHALQAPRKFIRSDHYVLTTFNRNYDNYNPFSCDHFLILLQAFHDCLHGIAIVLARRPFYCYSASYELIKSIYKFGVD